MELPSHFCFSKLHDRKNVCVMRSSHPLLGAPFTEEAFLGADHISYDFDPSNVNWLDSFLADGGHKRKIAVRCPSVRTACAICSESDLILSTTVPAISSYLKEFGLAAVPLPFPMPCISEYLIWHKRFDDHPGHRWFREVFLRFFGSFREQSNYSVLK